MSHRPVLYLLPGLLCDGYVWAFQRQALEDRYQVVIPDFLGMDCIKDMAASVLETAPERFCVAGHSMGARVALEMARMAGDRLDGLALFNTGTHTRRPGESAERRSLVELAYQSGMSALAARWLPPMVAPHRVDDAALMTPLQAMVERTRPEVFELQVQALLNRPDPTDILAKIDCHTSVAVGRLDRWSPVSQHESIVALMPDAELEIIEDSGHMSPVEQPEAVLEVLERWLERSEARRAAAHAWPTHARRYAGRDH